MFDVPKGAEQTLIPTRLSKSRQAGPPLVEVFRSHLSAAVRAKPETPSEALLRSILSRCERAWPGVKCDEITFIQALAERITKGPADWEGAFEAMHTSDLYLACATAGGNPEALAQFDRQLVAATSPAIGGVDSSPAFISEIQQQLRQKLLLPSSNQKPRIHTYSAQGSLKQWLRSAALRTALNARQGAGRLVSYPEESNVLLIPSDPELDLMKGRYHSDFKIALQAALAGLSSRDRTVLRLHWVDGLNIDKIGIVYRVHRSTVARWIAQSRQQLLESTKQVLKARLKISHSEFRSLVGLVRSQLHLSISRILQDDFLGSEREREVPS